MVPSRSRACSSTNGRPRKHENFSRRLSEMSCTVFSGSTESNAKIFVWAPIRRSSSGSSIVRIIFWFPSGPLAGRRLLLPGERGGGRCAPPRWYCAVGAIFLVDKAIHSRPQPKRKSWRYQCCGFSSQAKKGKTSERHIVAWMAPGYPSSRQIRFPVLAS